MTAPTASDFLLGSGAGGKSAKFPQIGATITGTIARGPEVKQQVDPDTGKPDTWDDGNPKWQIVVTLDTDERNPDIDADDGTRYLYVKGSKKPESQSLHAAVASAVQGAGATELEVGGRLTVTYVGDGVKPSPTRTAPKKYSAVYVTAAAAALGVPAATTPALPAAAAATPPAAAPTTPAATDLPYPPHLTPEQLAGLQAANVAPAVAWQMFPPPAAVA
ncbi:MAG: hypothetical protein L0K86_20215 [Actinomycetia bacterium]|nr:hypothetical protein [Actinomycetes bacterium]